MYLFLKRLYVKSSTILQKYLMLSLFIILPRKVTKIFVSLSIIAIIYKVKSISVSDKPFDSKKFTRLLHVGFNEDIMTLPTYCTNWFWTEDILCKTYCIDNKILTFREIIEDDELLYPNIRFVVDTLLLYIPKSIKYKLRLSEVKNRLRIKHNVIGLLSN